MRRENGFALTLPSMRRVSGRRVRQRAVVPLPFP
jgi:hypothetical protein